MDGKENKNNNYFETWQPDAFADQANYQKTLRFFSSPFICGDVLDIGCGSRVYYNCKNLRSWTGIDVSMAMMDKVVFFDEISSEKIKMSQGDAVEPEFDDNSFDTICSFFVIHHLARKNEIESRRRVLSALQNAYRMLRPGGTLVVAENAAGPFERPYHLFYSLFYSAAKKLFKIEMPYFWRKKDFIEISREAGFSEVQYMHTKIDEWIYNPVLRIKLPPVLSSSLFQTMTLYVLKK